MVYVSLNSTLHLNDECQTKKFAVIRKRAPEKVVMVFVQALRGFTFEVNLL